jgi:tetratricopeptide (TPR) repeat protein
VLIDLTACPYLSIFPRSARRTLTVATNMTQASTHGKQVSPAKAFSRQVVVFTGKLSIVGRREAHAVVEQQRGAVDDEITARTTILVVGAGAAAYAEQKLVDPTSAGSDAVVGGSNKLKKAEAVNAKSPGRIQILSEDEFCRRAALQSSESLKRLYCSLRQLRERYPLIREPQLRHLEKWGLVRPVTHTNTDTYYSFTDVAVIKRINVELERNNSFQGAVRRCLATREGQLALDFSSIRSEARPAKVVALRRREVTKIAMPPSVITADGSAQTALAARFFMEGSVLDEGGEGDRARARVAYRKALLLDPDLVPAIVNLANLHYANDDLVEAQALYSRALMLDQECFEAHFNLGNIHHDLGRYQEAMSYYYGALGLNPTYADAHFYLAVTLEKMGRSCEATQHWRSYQQLAPNGEWFDLAKEFSE